MQKRVIDVTDEIKILFTPNPDGLTCCVDLLYQGPCGYESIRTDFDSAKSAQDVLRTAQDVVRHARAMNGLREHQEVAKCFHTLVREQGLHQTIRDIEQLPALVRARHNGITHQADPESLPFPYDQLPEPPESLSYTVGGNWYYFDLNTSGDEVAFGYRGQTSSPFRHHGDLGPAIRAFSVKRLFEIYRADQSKTHLREFADKHFAGDLGL